MNFGTSTNCLVFNTFIMAQPGQKTLEIQWNCWQCTVSLQCRWHGHNTTTWIHTFKKWQTTQTTVMNSIGNTLQERSSWTLDKVRGRPNEHELIWCQSVLYSFVYFQHLPRPTAHSPCFYTTLMTCCTQNSLDSPLLLWFWLTHQCTFWTLSYHLTQITVFCTVT